MSAGGTAGGSGGRCATATLVQGLPGSLVPGELLCLPLEHAKLYLRVC